MMLHSGDNVRIRRFKDLCCEYNFDSDVYQNDSVWGHAENYMRNLNNQGILGDDMHLLCGQIVKIHNRTSPRPKAEIKSKIDNLHKKNEFKLKPMPSFDYIITVARQRINRAR